MTWRDWLRLLSAQSLDLLGAAMFLGGIAAFCVGVGRGSEIELGHFLALVLGGGSAFIVGALICARPFG